MKIEIRKIEFRKLKGKAYYLTLRLEALPVASLSSDLPISDFSISDYH